MRVGSKGHSVVMLDELMSREEQSCSKIFPLWIMALTVETDKPKAEATPKSPAKMLMTNKTHFCKDNKSILGSEIHFVLIKDKILTGSKQMCEGNWECAIEIPGDPVFCKKGLYVLESFCLYSSKQHYRHLEKIAASPVLCVNTMSRGRDRSNGLWEGKVDKAIS